MLNQVIFSSFHPFALEPKELKQMVKAIRDVETSLGSPTKKMLPEEAEMAEQYGHLTATQAATLAQQAGVQQLIHPGQLIRLHFLSPSLLHSFQDGLALS
jgi:hypothetical protein